MSESVLLIVTQVEQTDSPKLKYVFSTSLHANRTLYMMYIRVSEYKNTLVQH